MGQDFHLQKTLTKNDLGLTGSHQAGVHVPQALAGFFPRLDGSRHNPSTWIEVEGHGGAWRWRWIYYNGRPMGIGTRDEYRITHTAKFLRAGGANPGDVLELARLGGNRYRATLRTRSRSGILVLSTNGAWRSIAVR